MEDDKKNLHPGVYTNLFDSEHPARNEEDDDFSFRLVVEGRIGPTGVEAELTEFNRTSDWSKKNEQEERSGKWKVGDKVAMKHTPSELFFELYGGVLEVLAVENEMITMRNELDAARLVKGNLMTPASNLRKATERDYEILFEMQLWKDAKRCFRKPIIGDVLILRRNGTFLCDTEEKITLAKEHLKNGDRLLELYVKK